MAKLFGFTRVFRASLFLLVNFQTFFFPSSSGGTKPTHTARMYIKSGFVFKDQNCMHVLSLNTMTWNQLSWTKHAINLCVCTMLWNDEKGKKNTKRTTCITIVWQQIAVRMSVSMYTGFSNGFECFAMCPEKEKCYSHSESLALIHGKCNRKLVKFQFTWFHLPLKPTIN